MTNMEKCDDDPWEGIALSMVREIVEAREGTVPAVAKFSEIVSYQRLKCVGFRRR